LLAFDAENGTLTSNCTIGPTLFAFIYDEMGQKLMAWNANGDYTVSIGSIDQNTCAFSAIAKSQAFDQYALWGSVTGVDVKNGIVFAVGQNALNSENSNVLVAFSLANSSFSYSPLQTIQSISAMAFDPSTGYVIGVTIASNPFEETDYLSKFEVNSGKLIGQINLASLSLLAPRMKTYLALSGGLAYTFMLEFKAKPSLVVFNTQNLNETSIVSVLNLADLVAL